MKALPSLSLAALLASCCPCSPYGPAGRHELLLAVPSLPPTWALLPEQRMALTWRGPGGRLVSALAQPGSELSIEVERGLPQAILALPSSAGRGLMPAGALYPEGVSEGDRLSLDWTGGYAASLALALSGAGIDPWAYDLSRLAVEATRRCGDPWLRPALGTAEALAKRDFRIDAFGLPRRFAVSLPGPGPWAPESPFAPAGSVSGAGACVAQLPVGLWRFLGSGEELLVSVDAEGEAAFLRR